MKQSAVPLSISLAVLVLAAVASRFADLTGDPAGQAPAIDAEQATVDRLLERNLRESRTGVEMPVIEAAPVVDFPPETVLPAQAADTEDGTGVAPLPEGYSPGTYRGPMQRAPLTSVPDPEPAPNPDWLETGSAHEAILEQANRSGRAYTFAVLRVLPGTDLQALDRSLAALGTAIEGSTGEYVRIRVPAERSRLESIARLPGVLGVGAIPAEIKADETFVQEMRSRSAGEQVPVYITLMTPDSMGEWRRALSGLGAVVGAYDTDLRSYTANLPASALAEVLRADFVMYVEAVPVVTANHDSAMPVMGVDGLRSYDPALARFTGVTGSGIAVGVLDTGLNIVHEDISYGRGSICGANFVPDETWDLWIDLHGHGTHVFGTIAGAGRTDPVLAGAAPNLSHLRFGNVLSSRGSGSGDDIRRGMDYLARPSGCPWQGEPADAVKPLIVNMSLSATSLRYSGRGVGERKLDSVVHAYSQLYVVAQANSSLHGFSNYGTAKNSLAVGAVQDSGIIARFSSHGPTADGRLAPNVVGTGVNLTSPRGGASFSGHNTRSGTSMASPSVAGVAALLMEARPEFRNRPALTRARLMASAIRPGAYLDSRAQLPVDNTDGPGGFQNLYGLGLVSAQTSLYSLDDASGWLIGSASAQPENGAYEYIDIEVPEGAGRLDVVLTWDEQPADTLTRSVLNNLDLYADRGADCGADACGEHASRSEVDNVEWLLIEDPAPGTYRIKVVPVEIYGESNVAAVAWKILRGEARPELVLNVEETSLSGADNEYLALDVTIEATSQVASGTTIHLNCIAEESDCYSLGYAFLPRRSHVYRGDGLSRLHSELLTERGFNTRNSAPIPLGEIAVGMPRRLQLWFLRDRISPGTAIDFTATSWNAKAAGQTLSLAADGSEPEIEMAIPANDSFSGSERISGAAGQTQIELSLASREPGEPLVEAAARTVWYTWDAPTRGLFRFRVRQAETDEPKNVEYALFTGGNLVELEPAVQKLGSEISFNAEADTRYRLRIASSEWQSAPLVLEWESADARPANDDFPEALAIEGESGSLTSSNEGATLERQEFWGGYASTVWYAWTAPADGFASIRVDPRELHILAFAGTEIGGLRLVSRPVPGETADFSVRSGETYRIAVAARNADASGTPFTLTWELYDSDPHANARYNDYFSEADPIVGREGNIHGLYLSDAWRRPLTVEPSEPSASGIGTRWWYWTAPADGRFTWRLDAPEGFRLSIFTGDTLENLQPVASIRGGSTVVLDVTGDSRYWISTGLSPDAISASGGTPGSFTSSAFTWGLTPGNDNRADANRLPGASGSVNASLVFATAEPGEPRSTVGMESVWWNWTAPAAGWRRFWVDGHPPHAIVSVYPGRDAGVQSSQAFGSSERSYLASGLVEVVLYAQAGEQYDIRLSGRPGVDLQRTATLRWSASEAPAYLSYKAAVTDESMMHNPVVSGLHSPYNVAISDDGQYLFSTAERQVYAFLRDPESGEIAVAHIAASESNEDALSRSTLKQHLLWWNPLHDRLFAIRPDSGQSFAVPDTGSSLTYRRVDVDSPPTPHWSYIPTVGAPDGRHLFQINGTMRTLEVRRADSPEELPLVQIVSPHDIARDDQLVIPNLTQPVDVTLSPDGLHLYLVDRRGLFVFSRDTSTGMLELSREYLHGNDPDSPFYEMGSLRNAALDANASVLFVSAEQSRPRAVFDSAIAAFDISGDRSSPEHLDTLTGFDRVASAMSNHLKPLRNSLRDCRHLLPHADLVAVDVFCQSGYFVVRWNPETASLEVTDFAVTNTADRFGNKLPPDLGHRDRQMANSPDGKHAYRANDDTRYNAIYIFERASAMYGD